MFPLKSIEEITNAVPGGWRNDSEQKTDVAFLFPEIDSADIIDKLPVKKDFITVRYINRKNYSKSRINKLAGNEIYKSMTVRNINTVRRIAANPK